MIAVWLLAGSCVPATGAENADARLELFQKRDVVVHHQQFVGNIRAQAKRDGIIVRVPQLYIYHADQTPAWHMSEHRRGFLRELELVVSRQRRERNMVRFDRLLERTLTAEGEEIEPHELPDADVYVWLYQRDECEKCDEVAATVDEWLGEHPLRSAVWIDVWIDRQPGS